MELKVEGMSCEGCEEKIEESVATVEGVRSVDADRGNDTVTVEGEFDTEAVAEAVTEAGYKVLS